ncbi:MAG: nitroreductase family deazaflavin-dependent oxidoreductase [Chloroflexi bacterium]|nr:MAG: nitroreductase family deazaflavin-dependent oxidoreductase [Chloroflexota bacterium]
MARGRVMAEFSAEVIKAAQQEREVTLTTNGRKTGKPRAVTIWISTDGHRIFVRSGGGLGRDWPQNLMARGEGALKLGGRAIKVSPRHVTDPAEARAVSQIVRDKYGANVIHSKPTEPLSQGEQATFELLPAD